MPTVLIEYKDDDEGLMFQVIELAAEMPSIVAPHMNIDGRALHDGGVSENEILVDGRAYSAFAVNVNDIQVTVIAHRFDERVAKLDEMTEAIRQGIIGLLTYNGQKLKVGVSIWLVEMGYGMITEEDT